MTQSSRPDQHLENLTVLQSETEYQTQLKKAKLEYSYIKRSKELIQKNIIFDTERDNFFSKKLEEIIKLENTLKEEFPELFLE